MATPAQINANQQNAKHSTGPITGEGKAASAQNNFRHGLRGQFKVLPDESQLEFDSVVQALEHEYQPTSYTEELLVENMARHEWRTRRTMRIIDHLTMQTQDADPKMLAVWLRYQTFYTRSFHKCLNDLLKLKAERRRDRIGFERQKLAAATNARKQQATEARIRVQNAQAAGRELANQIKSATLAGLTGVNRSNCDRTQAVQSIITETA